MKLYRLARIGVLGVLGCTGAEEVPDQTANLWHNVPLSADKRSVLQEAIRSREYARAETLLASEAEANPKSQPLLLALANVLFLDGKQLNAALVLKKAELVRPLDERSRFLLALSWVSVNRKSLARTEFETLARAHPANGIYPYWLSRLTYKQDLQRGLQYAQEAVRLNPAFVKAYDQLAVCLSGLNQTEQAIAAFTHAVRLNEQQGLKWPWPSLNLGTLLLRLERFDEAEAALREAIRQDPRFPTAHLRLARVLEITGREDEAIAELKEAIRWDPTYPEPHYGLARIYRHKQLSDLAQQETGVFQTLRNNDRSKGITRPD